MWMTASSISVLPFTPKLPVPAKPAGFPATVLAASRRRSSFAVPGKAQEESEEETAGDEKQRGETSNQLRGLDVLWAMQKAAAVKSKVRNRKRTGPPSSSSSSSAPGEEEVVSPDYSNVRPVRLKRDWGAKLDDLERRLRRLSDETDL